MQIGDGLPRAEPVRQKPVGPAGKDGQQGGRGFDQALAERGNGDVRASAPDEVQAVGQDGAALGASSSGVSRQELLSPDILYPWQLVAQAAMSHIGRDAYALPGAGQVPAGAGGTTRDGIGGRNVAAHSPQVPAGAVGTAWHRPAGHGPTVAMMQPQPIAQTSGSARAAFEQALASLPTWAERFQRRVEDGQGRATVWLRDYQLDDAISMSTIDDIIAFYGPSRPVWRIVVNGSEVWRQPNNHSKET